PIKSGEGDDSTEVWSTNRTTPIELASFIDLNDRAEKVNTRTRSECLKFSAGFPATDRGCFSDGAQEDCIGWRGPDWWHACTTHRAQGTCRRGAFRRRRGYSAGKGPRYRPIDADRGRRHALSGRELL